MSEYRAQQHLAEFARRLRAKVPGSVIFSGMHTDTDRTHLHPLIFIPRRFSAPLYPAGVKVIGEPRWAPWLKLWWEHGDVWAEPYDPDKRGAAIYAARFVGTVELYGRPVPRPSDSNPGK